MEAEGLNALFLRLGLFYLYFSFDSRTILDLVSHLKSGIGAQSVGIADLGAKSIIFIRESLRSGILVRNFYIRKVQVSVILCSVQMRF